MKKKVVILSVQILFLLLFFPTKLCPQSLNGSFTCIPAWGTSTKNGSVSSTFNSVAVDTDGNVYAAGYIQSSGTCSFGNGVAATGIVENAQNAVLVKFNSAGKALWAKTLHDSPLGSCYLSVKVDSWGNVYTAGYIHGGGTYDFGDGVRAESSVYADLGGQPVRALVLVKYTSSGSAQWARTVGGDGNPTFFHAVAVDVMGNVYAAGRVTTIRYPRTGEYCTYDYGNGVIVSAKSEVLGDAAVLVKYSSTGETQWARTLYEGSSNGSIFYSVTVDGEGGIYAAGAIASNPPHLRKYPTMRFCDYYFGNNVGVTVDRNIENLLLVKYDSEGRALWARTVSTGTDDSRFSSVAVDLKGNLYAAGYIKRRGTYNFGNGVTVATSEPSSAHNDFLLVKYDSTGRTQWARTGDPFYFMLVNTLAITVDRKGIVYAVGSAQQSSTRDSSGRDIWKYKVLTQYDSTGASRAVVSYDYYDGHVSSDFSAVTTDLDCNIYLAGRLFGNGTCDFGYGITLDVNGTVRKENDGRVFPTRDEYFGVILKFVEQ
jgi:hypothetical protein